MFVPLDVPDVLEQDAIANATTGTVLMAAIRAILGVTQVTIPAELVIGMQLHAGDQLLDPLIDVSERILTKDRPGGLIVELEVYPVDGEVPAALLGTLDEVAT